MTDNDPIMNYVLDDEAMAEWARTIIPADWLAGPDDEAQKKPAGEMDLSPDGLTHFDIPSPELTAYVDSCNDPDPYGVMSAEDVASYLRKAWSIGFESTADKRRYDVPPSHRTLEERPTKWTSSMRHSAKQ